MARDQTQLHQSHASLDKFAQQVLALEPSSAPTNIWGSLSVVADEFASVDASERHVIVVARDQEIHSTYGDGCHDLRGAAVYFIAFDQPTPADQRRRRSDWAMWLDRVGASRSTFTRPNEPLPSPFSSPQPAAAARASSN